MTTHKLYDCAIIGGGLAGLSLSIILAKNGLQVILLEKETYPYHKVCGEYISMESWDFLQDLGVPLAEMQLPQINKLIVTAPSGSIMREELPMGGFGISRYKLDNMLKEIAVKEGVDLREGHKVSKVKLKDEIFTVETKEESFNSKVCCGAFGKRSNLDVKWKRKFIYITRRGLNNFVGIKYHIKTDLPEDTIALHNFKNGYCGVSRIEDGKYCLCYLTTAKNLKTSKNDITVMEEKILSQNPYLKKIFATAEKLYEEPLTISQISFNDKTKVHNNVLLLGDAAGMITPLCGNGMSMALHTAKLASEPIFAFLKNHLSRYEMEETYQREWKHHFAARIKVGRVVQLLFGRKFTTNLFVKILKRLPGASSWIIKKTHGQRF